MIIFFTYILQENLHIDIIIVYSSHSSFHVQRAQSLRKLFPCHDVIVISYISGRQSNQPTRWSSLYAWTSSLVFASPMK